MVKLYCPKCMDVYTPKSSRHHHTDGAYFGTGFPHMLFMVHPEYRPKRPANQFVPRFVPSATAECLFLVLIWALCSKGSVTLYNRLKSVLQKSSPMSHVAPGCTDLRSTPWPTSCSCKPLPASRAPSRPSARRDLEQGSAE